MKKKLISVMLGAAMLSSAVPVMAAPTYYTQDFSNVSTNGTGYTWLKDYQVGGMTWSSTSGWSGAFNASGDMQYNFSVADGVLGKSSGDKAWKWSLKRNAGNKTIYLSPTNETTDGEEFYTQSTVYIDEFASPNVFRTGGEAYLGNARKTAYLSFGPDGRIYRDNTMSDTNVLIDKYQSKNWYTVTMAFTAKDGVTNARKVYIDGKEIEAYAFEGSEAVKNAYMVNGWQFDTSGDYKSDSSIPVAEKPFWAMLDDFKVVEGKFNPKNENPDISSSTYTVSNPTFLASGSSKTAKISGIASGTTAGELLAGITPSDGGSVSVVTINAQSDASVPVLDSDDFKTVTAANSDVLTPNHKLVSYAAGSAVKIYDLEVEEPSEYEASFTSSEYAVDSDEKTISGIARGTKISRFVGNLTPSYGATLKVVDIRGEEVSTGYINNNLKVVVTSGDGKASAEYSVNVENTLMSDYRGSNSYLNGINVGLIQRLVGKEGAEIDGVKYSGAVSDRRNSIVGFYGGTWSNGTLDDSIDASFSKVIDSDGEAAYEFTNASQANIYRALAGRTLVPYNNKDKGDNVVLKYSIRPMAPGRYVAAWDIVGADSTGTTYSTFSKEPLKPQDITNRATPNISFQTDNGVNRIAIGVREADFGRGAYIGTWEVGKQYDVVMSVKKLSAESDGWYINHVSINGEEINLAEDATNPDGSKAGIGQQKGEYFMMFNNANKQGNYAPYIPGEIANDVNRNETKSWSWNTIRFSVASADGATPGKVNYNNIEVYAANDYVADSEIKLTSNTLEIYENDKITKCPTIKGFAGTVNTLKNAISMPEGAFLIVKDSDGNILSDSESVKGGMTVTVYSADSSVSKTYLLSDVIDLGKYYLYDSTGFMPVEKITDTDGTLIVQKTIKKYNLENIDKFTMIAAIYNKETDELLSIKMIDETEYDTTDGLMLNVDLSNYDTSKIYVKTMLFDSMNTMMPLSGVMVLAEKVTEDAPNATNQ